tara:strand:- start:1109 stop:1312 length:204 start_codon:yes stop_codon:yes gene_type:complete
MLLPTQQKNNCMNAGHRTYCLTAAFLGYIIFDEILEIWVWFGAIIIILAASYLAQLEIGDNPDEDFS